MRQIFNSLIVRDASNFCSVRASFSSLTASLSLASMTSSTANGGSSSARSSHASRPGNEERENQAASISNFRTGISRNQVPRSMEQRSRKQQAAAMSTHAFHIGGQLRSPVPAPLFLRLVRRSSRIARRNGRHRHAGNLYLIRIRHSNIRHLRSFISGFMTVTLPLPAAFAACASFCAVPFPAT